MSPQFLHLLSCQIPVKILSPTNVQLGICLFHSWVFLPPSKGRQVLLPKILTDSLLNKAQWLNLAFGSLEAPTLPTTTFPFRVFLDFEPLFTTTSTWESYWLLKVRLRCCFPQHISPLTKRATLLERVPFFFNLLGHYHFLPVGPILPSQWSIS